MTNVDNNNLKVDGLYKVIINKLFCYDCHSYFVDMDTFKLHQHDHANDNTNHDDKLEPDIEIKTDPDELDKEEEEEEEENKEGDENEESTSRKTITTINNSNDDNNQNKESSSKNVNNKRQMRRKSTKSFNNTRAPLRNMNKNQDESASKLSKVLDLISNLQNAAMKIVSGLNHSSRPCLEYSDSIDITCNICLRTFTSLERFNTHLNHTSHPENPNNNSKPENRHSSRVKSQFKSTSKATVDEDDENSNSNEKEMGESGAVSDFDMESQEDEDFHVQYDSTVSDPDEDNIDNNSSTKKSNSSNNNNNNSSMSSNIKTKTNKQEEGKAHIGRPRGARAALFHLTPAARAAKAQSLEVQPNPESGRYDCPREECSRSFLRQLGLKFHLMASHLNERPFKCQEKDCTRSYLQRRQLRAHIINAHNRPEIADYLCTICGAGFAEKNRLELHHRKKHETNESPEKRFKCEVEGCTKAYSSKYSLEYHNSTHSSDYPFPCTIDTCKKKFKFKCLLNQHLITHSDVKKYACTQCDKAFKQRRSLREHLKLHQELQEVESDSGRIKIFKCVGFDGCSVSFTKPESLQKHVFVKHNGGQIDKPFVCPENNCKSAFPNDAKLKAHVERVHMKTGKFLCPICGLRWAAKSALRDHVARHEGDKKFKCTVDGCSYASVTLNGLDRHTKTHTNERCYKCQHCGKGFNQVVTLKRHVLTHTKEKPHKCPHCPAAYPEKRTLKTHMKKHEQESSVDGTRNEEDRTGSESDWNNSEDDDGSESES